MQDDLGSGGYKLTKGMHKAPYLSFYEVVLLTWFTGGLLPETDGLAQRFAEIIPLATVDFSGPHRQRRG